MAAPATGGTGQSGNQGAAGPAATIDPAPDFYNRYTPGLRYLMLTLRQAEFNYLSGEAAGGTYQGAVDLLLWIARICTPPAGSAVDPARAEVLARATALLAQIGQKLNFYGQPAGHVPLASLAYYQSQLPGEIADGVTIETTYNAYVAAAGDQATQLAQLNTMLGALSTRIAALTALIAPLQGRITAYQAEVSELQLARNQQAVLFAAAEQKWEAQVIAQLKEMAASAECATYADVFDVAKGILTVEDPDDLGDLTAKFDFSDVDIATIQGLMGDVASWQDAITAIDAAQSDMPSVIGAISALGNAAVSDDSSKIAVERASFELTLEPFEKLDGTEELKDQLDLYLAKVQAANQSQVDYNALQIQLLNLNATIAQATAEQTQIQDELSHAQDPTIAAFKVFMARTYGESLDRIIKDVFGLSQAYRYWALADYTLPPSNGDWTMAYLADVQSDLTGKVLAAINDYGSGQASPTQPFDFRTSAAPVWLIDDPAMLASFRTNGFLDFSITPEDRWVAASFAGMAQVVATDFTVRVQGASTTAGNLFVKLTHSGMAPFVDTAGKRWRFSHYPVLTSYDYTIASGQKLAGGSLAGQEGVEIGLSPFTTWRLSALPADNAGLDLTKVDGIAVRFAGRYRTASGAGLARPAVPALTADRDSRPVHVLVSGGIDSTACIDKYLRARRDVSGVFVDYGQAAAGAEWDATQRVAEHYAIAVRRLAVDGGPGFGAGLIHGRNGLLIFAALTLGGASGGIIALGIHDGTDYYDCSRAFIDGIRPVVERCSGGLVSVEAPFANSYKCQIFDYARTHDVPLHLTYSCETGCVPPCGTCLSCGDVLIDHHRRVAAPYRQRS